MKALTGTVNFPTAEGRGCVYRVYEVSDNPIIIIFDEDMDMRLVERIKANIAGFPSETLMVGERKGYLTAILKRKTAEAEHYFKNIAERENGLDRDSWGYEVLDYKNFEEASGSISHPSMSYESYISLIYYILPAFRGLK